MDQQYLWVAVILSVIMLIIMFLRNGFMDPLFVIAAFYFYFAWGPVLSFLLTGELQTGVYENTMPEAVVIMLISQFTFLVVSLVFKLKPLSPAIIEPLETDKSVSVALKMVFMLFSVIGLALIAFI